MNAKVNLIALNPGPEIPFETPTPDRVASFQQIIRRSMPCFIRKPRGLDVFAACGQLKRMESGGLVAFADERRSVGRPKRYWRLTEKAETRFPDSHAQVAVELIAGMQRENEARQAKNEALLAKNVALMAQVIEAIHGLARITESHERRLDDLEKRG